MPQKNPENIRVRVLTAILENIQTYLEKASIYMHKLYTCE